MLAARELRIGSKQKSAWTPSRLPVLGSCEHVIDAVLATAASVAERNSVLLAGLQRGGAFASANAPASAALRKPEAGR